MALVISMDVLASSLTEGTSSGAEIAADLSIGRNPVGERVFAVLDDGFGSLESVVSRASFAGGDGGVVNELEEVLSVAGDDGNFLAMLT